MRYFRNICFSLLMLTLTLLSQAPALAAAAESCVQVSATASMEVAPDTADIRFEVNGSGATAAEATAASAAKMEAVKRALLGCNILGEDIVTTSYYLRPNFNNKGRITDYTAHNNVKIQLNDISKLGPVIDKISGAGVDTINNISFKVSHKELYRNQLLAQAVANARQQAAIVANAGGRTLGTLTQATIHNFSSHERRVGNIMLKADAAAPAPATSIEAQSITISASVDTSFALQ